MSQTPNYDAKVKPVLDALHVSEEVCKLTGEKWTRTQKEIDALRKFGVPPVAYSPMTRHWMITATWPGGQWWYNKCEDTGAPMICSVHPATGIKVLPDKEWFARDFQEFQMDLVLDRSFFDQLIDLRKKVPSPANRNFEETENSISIVSFGDVNSYFVVLSKSKNTMFSVSALNTESSAEVYMSGNITDSYQVIHSERIFKSQYVRESKDCMNCAFIFDCRNCEFCFGATNKRNQKYVWFNEQLSREEWEKRRAEVDLGRRSVAQNYLGQFEMLMQKAVWPENFNVNAEGCTGEYLNDARDCEFVYYADGGAKNEYQTSFSIGKAEGNVFTEDPANSQECYFSSDVSQCRRCHFCYLVSRSQNCEYSIECYDCENCFGCVGLRHKKFCILNKQYSEAEYWQVLDQLKSVMLDRGEYGEFLPPKVSPAWFPESGAFKYYFAKPEFGNVFGGNMFDPESEGAIGSELSLAKEAVSSTEVPDSVDQLGDWAGKALFDPVYKRRFSLIGPEVALYQQIRVAPPTTHHVKRVMDMIHTASIGVFQEKTCPKCSMKITVALNPHYPNRQSYCQSCYRGFIEQNG